MLREAREMQAAGPHQPPSCLSDHALLTTKALCESLAHLTTKALCESLAHLTLNDTKNKLVWENISRGYPTN